MRRGIVSLSAGERDIAAIFPGVYWPSTALLQVLWTAFVFPGRK